MAAVRSVLTFSKLYNPSLQPARRITKHWNPKYRFHRRLKVQPVDLSKFEPDFKVTREEFRARLKDMGLLPPRHWQERALFVSSSEDIIEPYVPPEGDGKFSLITKQGAKQTVTKIDAKRKSWQAIRKVKSYDEDFETDVFPQIAQDVYVKAHETLMSQDREKLSEFVTEKANEEMMQGVCRMTLKWKFLESIEPPRIVHARVFPLVSDKNFFSQMTVRFHTKQMLAVYDRFGRLMFGSEIVPKDVLEYVVFEKHIINEYGTWRLHGKIIPEWQPMGEPSARTFRKDFTLEKEDEDEELDYGERFKKDESDRGDHDSVEIIKKKEKPMTDIIV